MHVRRLPSGSRPRTVQRPPGRRSRSRYRDAGSILRDGRTDAVRLHSRKREPAAAATNELHPGPDKSGRQGVQRAGVPGVPRPEARRYPHFTTTRSRPGMPDGPRPHAPARQPSDSGVAPARPRGLHHTDRSAVDITQGQRVCGRSRGPWRQGRCECRRRVTVGADGTRRTSVESAGRTEEPGLPACVDAPFAGASRRMDPGAGLSLPAQAAMGRARPSGTRRLYTTPEAPGPPDPHRASPPPLTTGAGPPDIHPVEPAGTLRGAGRHRLSAKGSRTRTVTISASWYC